MSSTFHGNGEPTSKTIVDLNSPEFMPMCDSAATMEALGLLLQSRIYAQQLERSVWDFAVEIQTLREMGLRFNDLRWLIFQGLAEHARELTRVTDTSRSFGAIGTSLFTKRACFVLTESGVPFAETASRMQLGVPHTRRVATTMGSSYVLRENSPPNSETIPCWDCDLREIRYAGKLVKQYKLPSPNQEAILMTFEEERWPRRIDDPLPPHPHCDPKQRLHDTIRSLNRNQKTRLLRFKGDGTGEGVLWEAVLDAQPTEDED